VCVGAALARRAGHVAGLHQLGAEPVHLRQVQQGLPRAAARDALLPLQHAPGDDAARGVR